ncbi:hypothetical protein J6590_057919 [Homalodisca vitripennis]|nr:hypothetical protein J6590_057919 [Homalodisca vitripennis]
MTRPGEQYGESPSTNKPSCIYISCGRYRDPHRCPTERFTLGVRSAAISVICSRGHESTVRLKCSYTFFGDETPVTGEVGPMFRPHARPSVITELPCL